MEKTEEIVLPPSEPTSSDKLLAEMKNLREVHERATAARHQANGELQVTIGTFSTQALQQQSKIYDMEKSMREIKVEVKEALAPLARLAEDFKDVKARLIGDPDMKSVGLVDELAILKTRLEVNEKLSSDTANDQKNLRRERTIVASVIGTIGAVVVFLKGTAILGFLMGKN